MYPIGSLKVREGMGSRPEAGGLISGKWVMETGGSLPGKWVTMMGGSSSWRSTVISAIEARASISFKEVFTPASK